MAILTGKQMHEVALACGFDGCGVIPLSDLAGYEDRITEREEKIPMSAMVYDHLKRLAHPEEEHPWAKAAVVIITWVGKYKFPETLKGRYAKEFLLSQETLPEGNHGKQRFEDWMTEQGIRWAGGALCDVYTMKPLHCVSFMNTFGDGHPVPPTTLAQAGEWICGCDACQDVCPHNQRHDWSEGENFPGLDDITELLTPEQMLVASDEELREKIIPKTANHLRDDQTDLLRRMARNCLEQQEKEMA